MTSAYLLLFGLAAGQAPPSVVGPVPVAPPPVIAAPAGPVLTRPLTLCEFAATFKPAPGTYSVCLVHPVTHCPVTVCFRLPCGCPKKVKVRSCELKFDYGWRHDVEIRFKRDGTVKVKG